MPKTRTDFWQDKLGKNAVRDRRNQRALRKLGWKVIVVWECQVLKNPFAVLRRIMRMIEPDHTAVKYERLPDRRMLLREAEERLQWSLGRRGAH